MRMIIVAGLLMIALLGAVLGSIHAQSPSWISADDRSETTFAPPRRNLPHRPG
jgi:hypothetical protein